MQACKCNACAVKVLRPRGQTHCMRSRAACVPWRQPLNTPVRPCMRAARGQQLRRLRLDGARLPERGRLCSPPGRPQAAGVPQRRAEQGVRAPGPHVEPLHAAGAQSGRRRPSSRTDRAMRRCLHARALALGRSRSTTHLLVRHASSWCLGSKHRPCCSPDCCQPLSACHAVMSCAGRVQGQHEPAQAGGARHRYPASGA